MSPIGEASTADLEAWAEIVSAARAQAQHPVRSVKALAKACRRGPVIPLGHRERGGAFYRLFRLGQSFAGLEPADREASAAELQQLADECAAVLEALSRPRGWTARTDVFD